jgi:hypothetical protein
MPESSKAAAKNLVYPMPGDGSLEVGDQNCQVPFELRNRVKKETEDLNR